LHILQSKYNFVDIFAENPQACKEKGLPFQLLQQLLQTVHSASLLQRAGLSTSCPSAPMEPFQNQTSQCAVSRGAIVVA